VRLPDLSHGFLVSFAEPGAIAPVLIPLDAYVEGFCRELLLSLFDSVLYVAVENITDGLSGITNRTEAPGFDGGFLYLRNDLICVTA
jgi:hypothetical protein